MIELPEALVLAFSGAIGFLVAEGLQSLSRLVGRDLSGHATALTASIVGLLVVIANGLIAQVPAEYEVWVKVIIGALVILFAPAGFHSLFVRPQK